MCELISMENVENAECRQLLRVMCIVDDGAFDFRVLENVEKPADEVHEFITSKFYIHKNAKWMLIPCSPVV